MGKHVEILSKSKIYRKHLLDGGRNMILITLGTQNQHFKRLLDYVEKSNIKDEIIVQAGATPYKSKKMKIFNYIDYDKMQEYIEKADLIITHAGTGSILTPLKCNKKVIVCARKAELGEHADNHQFELVKIFCDEGYVLKLDENVNLDDLYKNIKSFKPKKYVSLTKKFASELKKIIDEK